MTVKKLRGRVKRGSAAFASCPDICIYIYIYIFGAGLGFTALSQSTVRTLQRESDTLQPPILLRRLQTNYLELERTAATIRLAYRSLRYRTYG